jgi:hypothetical protein
MAICDSAFQLGLRHRRGSASGESVARPARDALQCRHPAAGGADRISQLVSLSLTFMSSIMIDPKAAPH